MFSGERLDRGKQAFEQYIEQSPGGAFVPSAHWRLGMLYELMGDEKAAEREYRTSLELDPELDQARQALKTLAKSR